MSDLLIDDSNQTKVHIYHTHKTVKSVTIYPTTKARWFFYLDLLRKPCARASYDSKVYT